jgi:hypothetical protein
MRIRIRIHNTGANTTILSLGNEGSAGFRLRFFQGLQLNLKFCNAKTL